MTRSLTDTQARLLGDQILRLQSRAGRCLQPLKQVYLAGIRALLGAAKGYGVEYSIGPQGVTWRRILDPRFAHQAATEDAALLDPKVDIGSRIDLDKEDHE